MPTEEGAPEQETGSQLREKLEAQISTNKAIHAKYVEMVVKGFRLVKPEDLQGVDFGEVEAKAAEIENQRQAQQEELLKQALADRGIKDEDLDAALAKLSAGTEAPKQEQQATRSPFASTGALGGQPAGTTPANVTPGRSRIEAALQAGSNK